jgi:uncharacterized protein YndB with AHSA1/START domain
MQPKPKFVYVVYIASTPEKVFAALTDAKMSEQYWSGNRVVSDWKVGSPFTLKLKRREKNDIVGKVLEFDPPRRLAYTFHPHHDGLEKEGPSRVTFDIEPHEDQVKLTITHDEFPVGSEVFEHISRGWPQVMSSLKSFLESGKGMVAPWYREAETA